MKRQSIKIRLSKYPLASDNQVFNLVAAAVNDMAKRKKNSTMVDIQLLDGNVLTFRMSFILPKSGQ